MDGYILPMEVDYRPKFVDLVVDYPQIIHVCEVSVAARALLDRLAGVRFATLTEYGNVIRNFDRPAAMMQESAAGYVFTRIVELPYVAEIAGKSVRMFERVTRSYVFMRSGECHVWNVYRQDSIYCYSIKLDTASMLQLCDMIDRAICTTTVHNAIWRGKI